MSAELAYTLVASFAILFLAAVVYFHDRRSASNRLFGCIGLATVFWAIANYFSLNVSAERVLFWIRMVLFFAAPHSILFFLFVANFPERTIRLSRGVFLGSLVVIGAAMAAALSPLVFARTEMVGSRVIPAPGPLMPFFGVAVLSSLVVAAVIMVHKYLRAKAEEKTQWRVMLLGIFLSYLSLILTNFVLVVFAKDTSFVIFGPLFMLPAVIGMSYAILKHRFLHVKAIAAEILTFVILSVSLFEAFVSRSPAELVFRVVIFVLFFVFGILLIRSVLKEVEQRERLEVLTKELEAANDKLKELDLLKSEFISLASHQLRSPLAVIRGYLSMILEGSYGAISADTRKSLGDVLASAEQLIRLVTDLLNLSRIESGKLTYSFGPVAFADIIAKVVGLLEESAKAKGVAIRYENELSAPVRIHADFEKLYEVVTNLIDNAIKYSSAGEVLVRLEQVARDGAPHLRFSVRDSGIGIAAEDLPRLFNKFIRTEAAKRVRAEGMGIGLYFVKRVVEDHGGRIWAESPGLGKGSTFLVELPIREP